MHALFARKFLGHDPECRRISLHLFGYLRIGHGRAEQFAHPVGLFRDHRLHHGVQQHDREEDRHERDSDGPHTIGNLLLQARHDRIKKIGQQQRDGEGRDGFTDIGQKLEQTEEDSGGKQQSDYAIKSEALAGQHVRKRITQLSPAVGSSASSAGAASFSGFDFFLPL